LVLVFGAYYYYLQAGFIYALGLALFISLLTAAVEAISSNGYDNFSVPSIMLIIMYLSNFL
jgi:dolichol kinase